MSTKTEEMIKASEETKISTADPTPLGLFGLAMVTLVASTQKLGLTSGYSMVIPWAIFLGALAQLAAGIMDFRKNNVFGATAFCSYGFFWLGMALSWMISMGALGETLKSAVDMHQLGVAFIGYFIMTVFLTIGATRTNRVLFIIFLLIDFLFLGLFLTTLLPEGGASEVFHYVAAVAELLIAMLSFYGAGANVVNGHFGETVFPIGVLGKE